MFGNTKISKGKRMPEKGAVTTKIEKKAPVKKVNKTNDKLEPKVNVVRDSFTMPQSDYSRFGELKLACLKAGLHVKKSELLRAGLHVLCKLSASQLKKTIAQIEHIKTGRPKTS